MEQHASIGSGNTNAYNITGTQHAAGNVALIINGTGCSVSVNDTELVSRLLSIVEAQTATIERLTTELRKERENRTKTIK